ncbi:MAG: DUF4394 domain-containing protein, partial [Bacteroidales bacterium]|nr:DUF4394 domain-containing protein [Bacteroidales bacterium]
MKQITSLWLLMIFFASTALFAQTAGKTALEQFKTEQVQNQATSIDVDVERFINNEMVPRKGMNSPDEIWDVLYTFSAQAASCQAVATDGSNFYMTYWNGAGLFDKFDMDGNYIESFTIAAANAIRDFAYDGTYFYGAPSGGMSIAVLDLANQSLVSTITISGSAGVTGSRHLSYDPGLNNGNGGFWLGQWSELAAIDMSGNALITNSQTPAVASCYGSAYDNYSSPGSPKLWLFTQNAGASANDLVMLEEFDINSLTFTGTTLDLFTISGEIPGYIPGTTASQTIAGGVDSYVDANNKFVLAVNIQQSPNLVVGLELADAGPAATNDMGIGNIVSPVSGYDLGNAESVTITIKNLGTASQSNIPYEITWDGPTGAGTISGTYTGSIAGGETVEVEAGTADLSEFGEYNFEACTMLAGDENAGNDCKTKTVSNLAAPTLVYPMSADRWTGTTDGTAITQTSLVKGANTEDGWFVFDVTSIPAGATITSVIFHGYVYETNYPYWSLTPLTLDPLTADPAALKAEIQANSGTGVAYAYNNEASSFAPGWHDYTLGGTVNADMTAALAQGWFAMGMDSRDNSATYYINFEGWNETNVPYLEVEYTGGNPPTAFEEETFESYNAGDYLMQQAVAQGKTYWSTWSAAPGSAEDPFVTNAQAFEGSNSVVIEGTNDAVLYLNDEGAFTEGVYTIDFMVYIPTGKLGYFNTLQLFNGGSSEWGMQAYFDVNGAGLVDAGAAGAGTFTYTYDTWHNVKIMVDLDTDYAEMYLNDDMIVSWQWSTGSFGTGTLNELHAMNFYAWNVGGTPGAFFDNISISEGGIPQTFDPVTMFDAQFVADQGVEATWVDPEAGTWVGYDDGVNYDGLGLNGGGTFWGAIRWEPSVLAPFDGQYITDFKFFPRLFTTEAELTFMIWEGANAANLVYQQALSNLTWDEWNIISLDAMHMIDASAELWIGIKVVHVDGEYPLGMDEGPAYAGFGDMVTFDGISWESMATVYSIDNNFNLKALIVEETDGVVGKKQVLAQQTVTPSGEIAKGNLKATSNAVDATRGFEGVNIYRDNVLVNATPVAPGVGAYTDAYFVGGTYTYTAKAVYTEGMSDATPGVQVTIPTSGAPAIEVDPTSLSEVHVVNNTQTEQTLTITNTGTETLDWSIEVDLGTGATSNVTPIDPEVYAQLLAERQASEGVEPSSTGLAKYSSYVAPGNETIIPNLSKVLGRDMVYAFNSYDPSGAMVDGPITFDLDTPGTMTQLAATSAADFCPAGCWADGVWYAGQYGGGLYSVDETTGDMTFIGASPDCSGLAWDGSTLYGASITTLYTIDPASGAGTVVGAMGNPSGLMIAIACDAAGEIYGFDIGDDTFYSIDKATGAATAVGPMGPNFNYAQDMAFDKATDICYIAGYTTAGELYTVDVATGAATYVGAFSGGSEITALAIPTEGVVYTNDLAVSSIVSPVTGVELGNAEDVIIKIKNNGTASQSNFAWEVTWDGPTGPGSYSGVYSQTLAGGESVEANVGTADLSVYGDYAFEACVTLAGDENPDNDCKAKTVTNLAPSLCVDGLYTSGCSFGDGLIAWDFSDVNVANIPCSGTPPWYHDYRDMSHSLMAGETYTLTVQAGYADTYFDVWIDFNDDLLLTDDEIIVNDGFVATASVATTFEVTIPATATDGDHVLRFRTNWTAIVEDACVAYTYGNACDFTAAVGGGVQTDWLAVDMTSGTLGAGESAAVTVTFDSQGLTPDVYMGALMITSNAINTPNLNVPATLTVGGTGAAISVSPASMSETHSNPPQMTTQPLTLSNVGSADLTWDIVVDLGGKDAQYEAITPAIRHFDASQPIADVQEGVTPVESQSNGNLYRKYQGADGTRSVLYDNGPLVTAEGVGSNGSDYSELQDASLGMGTYGAGFQVSAGNSLADDFVVTGTWDITSFTFFGYQTGSGPPSTLNDVRVQVYDASPMNGGNVIWGDFSTNVMVSTEWTNAWRVLESGPTENRPIMNIVADASGLTLSDGTYWVEFQVGGTGASGPWCPAVTIVGEATTGNALQQTSTGWAALVDGGTLTPQGAPFIIEGTTGTSPWLSVDMTSGTIGAGGSETVNVTFNSEGLEDGTYNGTITINSNDANNPSVDVPVTLVVGGGSQTIIFEPFEDYDADDYLVQQAVNQGKEYWTTWSNSPGGAEDPFVSDAFAYAGDNSVVINGTNDAVLLLNDTGFTEGQYDIDFKVLIPNGFNGYFNTLQLFNGASSEWGMQAYFDAGGAGLVDAGGAGAGVFTYTYDTWHTVHLMIDLDADFAEMYFNGEMIVSWMWSGGSFGTGTRNELHAMNFYAWADNGTPGAHFDDIDISTAGSGPYGDPPTDLYGEVASGSSIQLYWTAPGAFEPEWLTYSQEAITNSIGTGAAAEFDVAARFTPDMLSGFDDGAITKINFVPGEDEAMCTYTLKVWQGAGNPTLVYSQAVTGLVADTWNEITLDTPVPFDNSQELWFGFGVNTTGGYPAGCDDGPQDEGFGNMMYWSGAWTTLTALNAALTYNWAVQGYVESAMGAAYLDPIADVPANVINNGTLGERLEKIQPAAIFEPTSRAFTGYNVYRDDVKVASNVQDDQYLDGGLSAGILYKYYVTSQYDEGESLPSNVIFIEIPDAVNEINANSFSIYPN